MNRRTVRIVATVALAVAGLTGGAYGDWVLWHPIYGVLLTLGAGSLVLVAVVIAQIPRWTARTVALGVLAFGLGLVGGQVLSPGRPALLGAAGTLTVALDQPPGATGAHNATCQMTDAGTELAVIGDPNLRLDVLGPLSGAPADLDQRAFVLFSITVGDRWPDGAIARTDNVGLFLSISSPAAEAGETQLAASDASDIAIDWTPEGGLLLFSGLVDARTGAPAPTDLDLRGTITWTCEDPERWTTPADTLAGRN